MTNILFRDHDQLKMNQGEQTIWHDFDTNLIQNLDQVRFNKLFTNSMEVVQYELYVNSQHNELILSELFT